MDHYITLIDVTLLVMNKVAVLHRFDAVKMHITCRGVCLDKGLVHSLDLVSFHISENASPFTLRDYHDAGTPRYTSFHPANMVPDTRICVSGYYAFKNNPTGYREFQTLEFVLSAMDSQFKIPPYLKRNQFTAALNTAVTEVDDTPIPRRLPA